MIWTDRLNYAVAGLLLVGLAAELGFFARHNLCLRGTILREGGVALSVLLRGV